MMIDAILNIHTNHTKGVCMRQLNPIDWLALLLSVIGGLNWGIYGVSGRNLVETFSGEMWWLPRVIFFCVGLAAIWMIRLSISLRKKPMKKPTPAS